MNIPSFTAGQKLPVLSLPITYRRIAGLVAATRDWYPGHHDPDFARSQGRKTIYANTVFLQGFLDRVALDWLGPEWFVHRRSMQMVNSLYPGDTLVSDGEVIHHDPETPQAPASITLRITGHAGGMLICKGDLVLRPAKRV